ncbi:MAG: hypothetical protein LH702_16200 [Phormidesmis sp. CAN_BIN44]|nr:hypothetical protein [Phormidesmis sp. CAN_BIN44]
MGQSHHRRPGLESPDSINQKPSQLAGHGRLHPSTTNKSLEISHYAV